MRERHVPIYRVEPFIPHTFGERTSRCLCEATSIDICFITSAGAEPGVLKIDLVPAKAGFRQESPAQLVCLSVSGPLFSTECLVLNDEWEGAGWHS
jgi:hypothetical protein